MLGCAVNGIGEASHADFGITGAKNEGLIFAHGKPLKKVPQDDLVDALFREIDKSLDRGAVEVDDREGRRGRRVAGADRGGERRRADPRADRRAGGREGPRGGQRRHRRAVPEAGQGQGSSSTRKLADAGRRFTAPSDRPSTTSTSSSPTSSAASSSTTACSSRWVHPQQRDRGRAGERVVYIGGTAALGEPAPGAVRRPRDAYDRYAVGIHHLASAPEPRGRRRARRGCASGAEIESGPRVRLHAWLLRGLLLRPGRDQARDRASPA